MTEKQSRVPSVSEAAIGEKLAMQTEGEGWSEHNLVRGTQPANYDADAHRLAEEEEERKLREIERRGLPEPVRVRLDQKDRLEDLRNRFNYHPPRNQEEINAHAKVRDRLLFAAAELDNLVPAGAERELMLRKLEEAMFWANAGLARARG